MSRRAALPAHRVLVDSSAYFALLDRRDQRHAEARAIQEQLIRQGSRLFTTSFVLAETHALLLARLSQAIATAFLREMERRPMTLIWVTPADVTRAREIIYRYDDKDFSLTDATSFAVMERVQVAYAFTFDHHFTQYGLAVLAGDHP
ncbi:MAG: type II toxin-antitoxin system VapC family toxin [Chloroflexota bacterium]